MSNACAFYIGQFGRGGTCADVDLTSGSVEALAMTRSVQKK